MTNVLVALYEDHEIGRVHRATTGRTSFVYDENWRTNADAFPLSLCMPLAASKHEHARVDAFLWGLLPDNAQILQRWARNFHTSANNAFGLIAHVGNDCAGAVRFLPADRLEQKENTPPIDWVDESEVAARLRALDEDISQWRKPNDIGQFSLAGAQPKLALFFDGKRWGIPSGRTATTHILKPGIAGLDGSAMNEHYCLALARNLGIPCARSEVRRFGDRVAIVVERYDRIRHGTAVKRVHQEDLCQALGFLPSKKYQNEGGPGVRALVELLRQYSQNRTEDIRTFLDAQAFNWLIAGSDAHAKNYSLLIAPGGGVRLAPLYDVASAMAYPEMQIRKLKLAMKIGGKYRLHDIGVHQWWKLCTEAKVSWKDTIERIQSLADELPAAAALELDRCRKAGLEHEVLPRLADELSQRATLLAKALTGAASYRG
jgi:serine/threonine-protein kinase HipA